MHTHNQTNKQTNKQTQIRIISQRIVVGRIATAFMTVTSLLVLPVIENTSDQVYLYIQVCTSAERDEEVRERERLSERE